MAKKNTVSKKGTPAADLDKLQVTDRETILFYKGRHNAFPDSHFYIVKDTNREVTFKKRLQPTHKVGVGYPVTITMSGRSYGTKRYSENEEVWPNKLEIAQWVRDNEAAVRESKRRKEEAGLRTLARELAGKIEAQYKRASSITKRDIIAAFIERLES